MIVSAMVEGSIPVRKNTLIPFLRYICVEVLYLIKSRDLNSSEKRCDKILSAYSAITYYAYTFHYSQLLVFFKGTC